MIHYDTKQQISSGKRSVGKTTAEAMMPEFWLISQVQVPEITMDVGEGRRKWKKSTLKNSAFSWRIVISPHFESRTPQRTFQVKRKRMFFAEVWWKTMSSNEFNLQGISQNESPENLLGSKPFGEQFGTRLIFNLQPLLHETETPKHL